MSVFTFFWYILFLTHPITIPVVTLFLLWMFSYKSPKFLQKISFFSCIFSILKGFLLYFMYKANNTVLTATEDLESFYLWPLTSLSTILHSFEVKIDSISIFFICLTNIFIYLCIFSLNVSILKYSQILFHLFFLQLGVLCSFMFYDLLAFFIFFEMTLIPIYFLVLFWGSRERRVRASYFISLYTLFGSLFMFFNILYLYSKIGTTNYEVLLEVTFSTFEQRFLGLTFLLAFAPKVPLFPFHIWLPEAHVEAPTVGSVLLAVLLLKLGTYGMIRFAMPLFSEGITYSVSLFGVFALMGIIYSCFCAIRQIDLKKIIAYSSVGHMNVVLLGLLANNMEGLEGGIFQMLSHGVVSGAMFFCVGTFYERHGVRSLKYISGLVFVYPLFAIIFLIFSMANISFPLTSSFIGEFVILMGVMAQSFWIVFFASTSMVLGAVYTLWTYNRIFFGNLSVLSIYSYKDVNAKEISLYVILIFCLFFMGLCSYFFFDFMHVDCLLILERRAA